MDAEELWERGNELLNLGRLEEAIASFDQALKIQPEYHEAWYNRGFALVNLGRLEEAIASYDQALKVQPDDHEAWYNRGVALRHLGRWEEAIASWDQALKIQPDDHEAWYNRGVALGNLGRWEEAIASWDQAVKIQPDLHKAWNNQGVALMNLGRLEEAIASWDQALKFKPDKDEAWNNRGVALWNLGRLEEAIASYDQALKFKPDKDEAWNNRGVALWNLGRLEEAIASYDQALKFKPDYYEAWNNRGFAAGRSVSCDRFLASQSSIARKHPELNQRGYEGQLASYEQGLKYCPQDTHPEGWGKLHQAIGKAHYFRGLGDSRPRSYWDKAFKSYRQALQTLTAEAFPEAHLEVLQDLINLYGNLGDYENLQVALAQGTVVLEGLLEKTASDAVKIQLSRKFASFAQFYVDQLVQKGQLCEALEFAELRKNLCLSWLHRRWNKSTDSPKYAQMQQLLQPLSEVPLTVQLSTGKDGQLKIILPKVRRKSVGVKVIVFWHISPITITTFILRDNQPLRIVSAKNGKSGSVCLPSLSELDPPQPPLKRGENQVKLTREENSLKVPLIKGDLGGSSGLTTPPSLSQLRDFEKWMETWKKQENFRHEMPNRLKSLAEILNIEKTLKYLEGVSELILIPHRDLNLLPLHALFPNNFTIKYLPSIKIGLARQNPTQNISLLSVENPREDLRYASQESESICKLYPKVQRIQASAATITTVKTALSQNFGIFHFTGHAEHNLNQPELSALILANQEKLTLKDILESDLSPYNLACLAACKTYFTSKDGLIDEFIGLASGFVAAGVNNVVGSLWKVDDCSTAYLMTKFHEILNSSDNYDVASALKVAQDWLKNATNEDLKQFSVEISQSRDVRFPSTEKEEENSPDYKPFSSPYYWAGFCAIGL